jgi:pimeloyl-ACP methyl ester carboxylesterase
VIKTAYRKIPGTLVTLPLPGRASRTLDGFWTTGSTKSQTLLIFVHGMGSNFYKSKFKKAWMERGPKAGIDVFSFNNRGCEGDVADERFVDCLADIDAALNFARVEGYRNIFLLGHSTGCQKITYYHSRRNNPRVKGLILAALGDDLAIAQRDLGRAYPAWLAKARALVAEGRGDKRLPPRCLGFTARRFLSAVDPNKTEAQLFHLNGKLRVFRSIRIPILAVFPQNEQYACIPVEQAADILAAATRSEHFTNIVIPDADHSFHGQEIVCVDAVIRWILTCG